MSNSRRLLRRSHGFSLVEVMVGIVIALIAVLVIYQVFDVSESIKRNATGAGDAQQNGLLSAFSMMLQFSNAGANIAVVGDELDTCPFYTGAIATTNDLQTAFAVNMRPIPVLVLDSGSDTTSDAFVVGYGASERIVTSVDFASAPSVTIGHDGDTYSVQSPLGFQKNDVVIVMSADAGGAGICATSVVKNVSAVDADGYVTLTHSEPMVDPAAATAVDGSSSLLNLGASPRRVMFDVDSNGTLRSQELFHVDVSNTSQPFGALDQPTPIANNIVLMKIQYGVGDPTNGFIQKWVKAGNDGTEDWSASTVLGSMTYQNLSRIKAVRIALIVRSESYDKCAYADVCPGPTTNKFSYSLFGQCDGIPCPAAITGSLDPTPGSGNFRYRVYETVVPLRNAVWNLRTAS